MCVINYCKRRSITDIVEVCSHIDTALTNTNNGEASTTSKNTQTQTKLKTMAVCKPEGVDCKCCETVFINQTNLLTTT